MEEYLGLKVNKEEQCKGCPQIKDCNNTPINCLRRWSYMFTGKW